MHVNFAMSFFLWGHRLFFMKFLWLEFATKNVPANYMRSQVKKKHLMEPYSIYRYTYNTKYQCNCKERCYIVHVNVQSINVWHYCTALSLIYCLFWGRMMPWFLASDFVSVYHQILKRQYSILITNNNDK